MLYVTNYHIEYNTMEYIKNYFEVQNYDISFYKTISEYILEIDRTYYN